MKKVDPSTFTIYRDRADAFLRTIPLMQDLDEPGHGPSLALLAVHAAISLTDAVLVVETGARSDDDHSATANELKRLAKAKRLDAKPVNGFQWLLSNKNHFAYDSKSLNEKDVKTAVRHAQIFATWVFESFKSVAKGDAKQT